MDVRALAAMVPALMATYPRHGWAVTSGFGAAEDLVIELSPVSAPDRAAQVHVMRSAEVYFMEFAGAREPRLLLRRSGAG